MKYLYFFLLMLTSIGLHSCKFGTAEIHKDESIQKGLKNEISLLDEKILKAVSTKDSDLLKSIMSDGLLEYLDNNVDELIKNAGDFIIQPDYKILDQFYSENRSEEHTSE